MMKITGLSHLFKWDNLHNWWLTKYFFAPLYIAYASQTTISSVKQSKTNVTLDASGTTKYYRSHYNK